MAHTFAKDVMNKDLIELDGSTSIQDAASKMTNEKIGSVIVTVDGKHVGILTEKDFITIASEGRPLFTAISEVMSSPIISIDSGETVWEAAELMKEKNIHKIPVQENDKIVGILTATDLVKICSLGSDSEMRRICDQILMRMKPD